MENKEQIEYVIANLSEQEISELAMFTLQKTEVKTNEVLTTYAAIKAKIYDRKAECTKKSEDINSIMSGRNIF